MKRVLPTTMMMVNNLTCYSRRVLNSTKKQVQVHSCGFDAIKEKINETF